MAVVDSQFIYTEIDEALAAVRRVTTGFNPAAAITTLAATDTIAVWDGAAKFITWANLMTEIVADKGVIVGPSSATNNAIVRFDTTSGDLVQDSSVLIDDSDNITGVVALTATGLITGATLAVTGTSTQRDIVAEGDSLYDIGASGVRFQVIYADTVDGTTLTGTLSTASQTNITGVGTIATGVWSATDVAVAAGGTGSSTASGARTNLGLVIGTDVLAYDADVQAIADLANASGVLANDGAGSFSYVSQATGTVTSVATAGTVNGLTLTGGAITTTGTVTLGGTLAINDSDWSGTDLAVTNGGTGSSTAGGARTNLGLVIGTNVQAYDAGLLSIGGLTTLADRMIYTTASDTYAVATLTSFSRTLLDDSTQGEWQTTLDVDPAGTDNSTNATLAGSLDYITLSGQVLTRNAIVLTTDVSGTLPVANGGTGLTSLSTLLNSNVTPASLGLVIGTNVQAYDSDLATWAGLTPSANAQSLVTAANYAAMRALLDLEAGTDFYSISAADAAFQPLATVLTNTTASFLTAQETKLSNITVTQAVDLDAIETASGLNTTHSASDGSDHADVVTNSAKVTNATHTGDVTGSVALALNKTAVSGQSLVTAVGADHVIIIDATDGNLKKALISDFASAGGDMATATYDAAAIAEQLVGLTATQTLTNKKMSDSTFSIVDQADNTRQIAFQASGVATSTTRTITMPNTNVALADIATNTTHGSSDGSDHSFLDQSVISGATPTFTATNITGVPAASVLAGTLGTGAYVFDNTVSGITTLTATTLAGTLSTATQNSVTTMTALVTVATIGTGVWQGTAVQGAYTDIDVSELTDVTISGIASGELLKWNGSAFINNTLAEAGIGDMAASTYDAATIAEQLVGLTATQTLTNKKMSDSTFSVVDNADNTKEIAFQASGIATSTTRTITMPDEDVDLGVLATTAESIIFSIVF